MSKKVEVSIKRIHYGRDLDRGYTEILRYSRDIQCETNNTMAFSSISNLLEIIANTSLYYEDKDCVYCAYKIIYNFLTKTGGLGGRTSCPSEKLFPFTYKSKETGNLFNCLMEVKVIKT